MRDRTDAIAWLRSACAVTLRQSQARTLVALVAAATRCERVSLASIGRQVGGEATARHRIKRT